MAILIKNGRVIGPSQGLDAPLDILIEGNTIADIAPRGRLKVKDAEVIDATGMIIAPGLIDMHCHLREPGFEYKEDIASGTKAAATGGFTTVCCMPNTSPVNDNRSITEYIINQANKAGNCRVLPIGAITKGSMGGELAEMGDMFDAGCVGFSDDGKPVVSAEMMRRALEYARTFSLPIISHCEEPTLAAGGVMNEGEVSTKLGLRGIPSLAEEIMAARDILLAKFTGGRLHLAHISTAGSVELVRRAKAEGVNVTAETCPHYFTLTEDKTTGYDTNFKVNPPLRTEVDRQAIIEGLSDGTIDVIATDHAPHAASEKEVEFDIAPFGISGFETALALSMQLVIDGRLGLSALLGKLTANPAKALGLTQPKIDKGEPADLVIIDLELEREVTSDMLVSKGKNTAYAGMRLRGWPVVVIYGGKRVFQA